MRTHLIRPDGLPLCGHTLLDPGRSSTPVIGDVDCLACGRAFEMAVLKEEAAARLRRRNREQWAVLCSEGLRSGAWVPARDAWEELDRGIAFALAKYSADLRTERRRRRFRVWRRFAAILRVAS